MAESLLKHTKRTPLSVGSWLKVVGVWLAVIVLLRPMNEKPSAMSISERRHIGSTLIKRHGRQIHLHHTGEGELRESIRGLRPIGETLNITHQWLRTVDVSDLSLIVVSMEEWGTSRDFCNALTAQCNIAPHWMSENSHGGSRMFYSDLSHLRIGMKQQREPETSKTTKPWGSAANLIRQMRQRMNQSQLDRTVLILTDASDVLFMNHSNHESILRDFLDMQMQLDHTRVIFNGERECHANAQSLTRKECKQRMSEVWNRTRSMLMREHLKCKEKDIITDQLPMLYDFDRWDLEAGVSLYLDSGALIGFFEDIARLVELIHTANLSDIIINEYSGSELGMIESLIMIDYYSRLFQTSSGLSVDWDQDLTFERDFNTITHRNRALDHREAPIIHYNGMDSMMHQRVLEYSKSELGMDLLKPPEMGQCFVWHNRGKETGSGSILFQSTDLREYC